MRPTAAGGARLLHGEYGLDGVFLGVPAHLGTGGVAEVVELRLTEQEREALHQAATAIRHRLDGGR